ncbi:MAG: hypothetical protein R3F34_10900 [Planctomycetota bacterium]
MARRHAAAARALRAPAHGQAVLRARDADVRESTLLLHRVVGDGARVREDALLETDEEHLAELEPLGGVQRHEVHDVAFAGLLVVVAGVERELLEEAPQAGLLAPAAVVVGELDQVLDGAPALRARQVVGVVAVDLGAVAHALHQFAHGLAEVFVAHASLPLRERLDEGSARARRGLRHALDAVEEGLLHALPARTGRHLLERRVADAARRAVRDAQEADVVVRVRGGAQVGEDVADLLAIEERRSADEHVRDAAQAQLALEHARLLRRAEEDREVAVGELRVLHALLDAVADRVGLGRVVRRREGLERRAVAARRTHRLVVPHRVVADHPVRALEDLVRRAVVRLELDDLRAGVVRLELQDLLDARAAPAVDRLVVVPDRADVPVDVGELSQQLVLRRVRVLVLVDHDVAQLRAQHVAQRVVLAQQPHAADQEVVEVEQARAQQPGLVLRVDLGEQLLVVVARALRRLGGRDEVVLEQPDAAVERADQAVRVGDAAIAHDLSQARRLVARVGEREAFAAPEQREVLAQELEAERVEGGERDVGADRARELLHPLLHLGRGLVREGDAEDRARVHAAPQEERRPNRDDARLARTRTREHEKRPLGGEDRLALLVVERLDRVAEFGGGLREHGATNDTGRPPPRPARSRG